MKKKKEKSRGASMVRMGGGVKRAEKHARKRVNWEGQKRVSR